MSPSSRRSSAGSSTRYSRAATPSWWPTPIPRMTSRCRLSSRCCSEGVDGFMLATGRLGEQQIIEEASAGNVPVVLVSRDSGVGKHPFVSGDEAGGSSLRQHISLSWATATSCTSQAPPNFSTAPSRSRASPAAALNAGILHDSGCAAAEVLLERRGERPTALVAGNDLVARGLIRRLDSRGLRCPEDVSIVGFDDKPFAEDFWPPLTTVHMPLREIGGGAARLLRHGIESGE